jgi:hypothetical protein
MKIKEIKMVNNDYTTRDLYEVFDINQSTYYDRINNNPPAGENKRIVTILKQTVIDTQHT